MLFRSVREGLIKANPFGAWTIQETLEQLIEEDQAGFEIGVKVIPFRHGEFGIVYRSIFGGSEDRPELVAASKTTCQKSFHRLLWRCLQIPLRSGVGAYRFSRDTDRIEMSIDHREP